MEALLDQSAIRRHLVLVSSAALLAFLFTVSVLAYYRAYHFGVGAAYGISVAGLALAFAIALASGYLAQYIVRRRGGHHLSLWAIVAMAGVLGIIFAALWDASSDARERDESASTLRRLTYAAAGNGITEWRLRRQIMRRPCS
jgi:MFS family permease